MTTLLFGVIIWIIGATAAQRFGVIVDELASLALIGFGLWIAYGAWREMRQARHDHDHHHHHHHHHHHQDDDHGDHSAGTRDSLYAPLRSEAAAERHVHVHQHGSGPAHLHWHDHPASTAHAVTAEIAANPPLHDH